MSTDPRYFILSSPERFEPVEVVDEDYPRALRELIATVDRHKPPQVGDAIMVCLRIPIPEIEGGGFEKIHMLEVYVYRGDPAKWFGVLADNPPPTDVPTEH